MNRDYLEETRLRVAYIQERLREAGAEGVIYGNSGGKDSALVGILCKKACPNTLGIILPAGIQRSYTTDKLDALRVAEAFSIQTLRVDLGETKDTLLEALYGAEITEDAKKNIAPRLRMTALYAIAQSRNALVAGTGNRSEAHVGYFTKWGDGACDFNPIADLTVTEVYEFLQYLGAPDFLQNKPPSAGLFDGQTDETEMGFAYSDIDAWLLRGEKTPAWPKIEAMHQKTNHKRIYPSKYEKQQED